MVLTGVFSATFPDIGGVAAAVRKSTGAVGSLTIKIKTLLLSNKLFFNYFNYPEPRSSIFK